MNNLSNKVQLIVIFITVISTCGYYYPSFLIKKATIRSSLITLNVQTNPSNDNPDVIQYNDNKSKVRIDFKTLLNRV